MKRLIVTGPRQARFDDVPDPECPVDGLLVRARVTAVSTGTEIRVYRAQPVDEQGRFLHERVPFVLPTENGYSMVGDVIAVGVDATKFAIGDRVFVPSPHKEIAAVSEELAVKLPAEIPDEQAAFLNILEVGHIAVRRGSPTPGENVALLGQGVVGLSALAYCKSFGFRTAVIDSSQERLEIARVIGADLALSPLDDDCVARVIELFDAAGADLVIEATSNWSAIQTAMYVAAADARIVVAARHTDKPDFNLVGHPYLGKKLTLLTSYGHEPPGQRWDRRRSIALTLDLLFRGRLNIAPLITHRIDHAELPEMYRRLDGGDRSVVGVVVHWN
ncbi:MAG: zinc-binding alcohol dehydrogenase [Planctomycetes bacterium]|nr:zinc-binding alcohol dehydrogenase [Planctomycetota bacterium]